MKDHNDINLILMRGEHAYHLSEGWEVESYYFRDLVIFGDIPWILNGITTKTKKKARRMYNR